VPCWFIFILFRWWNNNKKKSWY